VNRVVFFIFFLFLFSCNTLRYDFSEKIEGKERINYLLKILENSVISNSGQIEGVFIEKEKSYYFTLNYNIEEDIYNLKFYNVLDKNILVFNANLLKNEPYYDYYVDSFFSVKIGYILKRIKYIFKIDYTNILMFTTRDDFIVLKDKDNNYYKYEDNLIIKKENNLNKVKYFYTEDKKMDRIEFVGPTNSFILTFN